ncbi:ABC transporter permease [Arthrobacter sp. 35W]|uniref:ABC transporter permease n=1 Tax=Arthrobacter sp. 35W TaxID=1132441 RepID=UPI0004245CAF|nr:ABC transporter permease [Arthrobacter sp. 35W]
MSGFISALVEAWSELRIHKTRILLALVGVAVSVAALASVVGVGQLARESMQANSERQGGREATLGIIGPGGGSGADRLDAAYDALVARYGITYSTRVAMASGAFQFPGGVRNVEINVVDPAYGVVHRVDTTQGGWFAGDDGGRLAPAVVVNEAFYNAAGRPDLTTDPVVGFRGDWATPTVMVGVVADQYPGAGPMAYMLTEGARTTGLATAGGMPVQYKLWVPPENAEELRMAMMADLQAALPGMGVEVYRSDYAAYGDPFAQVQLAIGGIAVLVLLLGAIGLLNISMVTVRYRVREIGIRRSFGATSGRIFAGVLMESVVATTVAGALGVMVAIAVVKNPFIEENIAPGLTDYPAFPLEAALLGMGAAVLVGALAGAIPALVAIRVKVIDAIRF